MSEKQVSVWQQVVEEVLNHAPLRDSVKINQNVVSKDRFQTCSMIMARVIRRPAFRIRYSKSANSFEVNSIRCPARSTRRSTRSSFRSSTVSTDSAGRWLRRSSARIRAESSENEN